MAEYLREVAVIWRGEIGRAVRSGRVVVLLLLFASFVALALAVVGFLSHQLNAGFEQQVAQAGADLAAARAELLRGKRQFLGWFIGEAAAASDAFASVPLVLLVVFKLTCAFVPLFVALMGFDQLSAELAAKSLRYLVVRASRAAVVDGKLFAQATVFALLLAVCIALMVLVARLVDGDFDAGAMALWTLRLLASALALSSAYLALTALCSALTRQGGVSLVTNVLALFGLWALALVGGAYRFPGEAASGPLGFARSESFLAWLRYTSVWHFGAGLQSPSPLELASALAAHVGYALVFLGLARLVLDRRDV